MRPLLIVASLAGWGLLGVVGAGCQTYDFEPVSPQTLAQTTQIRHVNAKHLKPNLWLVVDKSGSMNGNDARCGGMTCTRIAALKSAMAGFVSTRGKVARMALTFYPTDTSCGVPSGPGGVAESLPPPTPDDNGTDTDLQNKANSVNQKIQDVNAGGGTPTGATIAFVGDTWAADPALLDPNDGRDDFILLLTDGLPNCNPANENMICGCYPRCAQDLADRCACTINPTATGCNNGDSSGATGYCSRGCLDRAGASVQIAAQKKRGIRTIVLAFGPDLTDATETLAAMAAAGGGNFRTCPSGNECGANDECVVSNHLCRRQYYTAQNSSDLGEALEAISRATTGGNPCELKLDDQPSKDEYIAVIVNGQDVPRGPSTWEYTAGSVLFAESSSYCAALKNQEVVTDVEIRYVKEVK